MIAAAGSDVTFMQTVFTKVQTVKVGVAIANSILNTQENPYNTVAVLDDVPINSSVVLSYSTFNYSNWGTQDKGWKVYEWGPTSDWSAPHWTLTAQSGNTHAQEETITVGDKPLCIMIDFGYSSVENDMHISLTPAPTRSPAPARRMAKMNASLRSGLQANGNGNSSTWDGTYTPTAETISSALAAAPDGWHWENDASYSKKISLKNGKWKEQNIAVPAHDGNDHDYYYYIKTVNERNLAEGTTAVIGTGLINQTAADKNLNVTNNLPVREIDVTIVKVDRNHLDDTDPPTLKAAAFRLEKYTSSTYQSKDMAWGDRGCKTLTDTGKTGTFVFTELAPGFYKIVETVYPDGYISLTEDPIFEVRMNNTTKELEVILLNSNKTDSSNNRTETVRVVNGKVRVGNEPGAALPNSGGPGTGWIYLLGLIFTGLAGIVLLMKESRKAA